MLTATTRARSPFVPKVFNRPTRRFPWRMQLKLVNDDSQAEFIGIGVHDEPEVDLTDEVVIPPELLPPAPDPLPPVQPGLPGEALQAKPVPLDGAPRKPDDLDETETLPADSRSSFGWIVGTGNQLGMLEWVDRDLAVFDYTLTDRSSMHLEPGFTMVWLTGPTTTDLPPYLFSIVIDAAMSFKINNRWSVDTVITPSWNTDFANKSSELFRLPWQVVNSLKVNEELKLVVGVTDLDREDIQFLPVAGFTYKPLDGSRQFDLIFPRPKMAWRLGNSPDGNLWGYIAGELGGNSYAIQRPGTVHDIVTLRDYRLLFGWEHRGEKRHATRFEAGWVFGRAVEYASGIGDYCPSQTAIIRFSSDF
jgi:hypothetical protein